ncbi:hypothetical protein PF008_g29436 [Phytophthora fragariae]|uniref:Uncharacterized protein n=1 Tax=Phytophthora fragariae TaxID=53985 RepID=A0A6G0Q8G6_9STRA|nr:hypothetical protein PF008_g29436 [Phytophthora fragariae]
MPATDSGGGGHRPPDPGGRGVTRPPVAATRADTTADGPANQPPIQGGPHQIGPDEAARLTEFPALVTTPSDAQGGNSDPTTTTPTTPSGGPRGVTNTAAGGATHPSPLQSFAAVVGSGGNTQGRLVKAQPLPSAAALGGRWTPQERHVLLETLAKPWHLPTAGPSTGPLATLHAIAVAPSEVHLDTALRDRTKSETEALLAYLNGSLELPHAPNFLKATMPLLHRAMVEQFHETHMEVTLTADISPRAKLRRNMTHQTVLALLYAANADSARGRQMIDRVMDDVKLIHFDGIHTLKFVFNSRRVATLYQGLAFRLMECALS